MRKPGASTARGARRGGRALAILAASVLAALLGPVPSGRSAHAENAAPSPKQGAGPSSPQGTSPAPPQGAALAHKQGAAPSSPQGTAPSPPLGAAPSPTEFIITGGRVFPVSSEAI